MTGDAAGDNGGRTAAVLFSMTASCKRHGIDPFRFLTDVLRRLATTLDDRRIELLPDVWFETHPQAARKRAALLEHAILLCDNLG
jgi:transposase